MEDRLCYWKIKYHWRINCCVGRSTVLFKDKLYYWKINCNFGRSVVFSEDLLYWRQSTEIDGNYRSRKIIARRWLHEYVGAECGASSFTWYLYQMCNTDIRVCGNHLLVPAITRNPFKLGSPNFDQRCKRPWLRSLMFWGAIDLDLQGPI